MPTSRALRRSASVRNTRELQFGRDVRVRRASRHVDVAVNHDRPAYAMKLFRPAVTRGGTMTR